MTELAKALCAAQAKIDGAKKDSTNPHFKAKYADLASVWEACRKALTENGLAVAQYGRCTHDGQQWVLVTELIHASGDYLRGEIPLLNGKGDMQGLGSALTYARRYGLAAMVGVSPEDDDGNAATAKAEPKAVPVVAPAGYDDWRADFIAAADNGLKVMTEAWMGTPEPLRQHWQAVEAKAFRDALKAKAMLEDSLPVLK